MTWFGLSGPANMPRDVVDKLNAEVIKAFKQPDVRRGLRRRSTTSRSAAEFTDFFVREMTRWTPIAKATGAAPQ